MLTIHLIKQRKGNEMVKVVVIEKDKKEKQEIKTIQDIRNNVKVAPIHKGSNIYKVKFRVFTVCNVELDDNETEINIYEYLDRPECKPFFECVLNKFNRAETQRMKKLATYYKEKKDKKNKK